MRAASLRQSQTLLGPGVHPFRYQGQYEDTVTGLYYNLFRYYNPEDGVYLTQDLIRIDDGDRLYRYVRDTLFGSMTMNEALKDLA